MHKLIHIKDEWFGLLPDYHHKRPLIQATSQQWEIIALYLRHGNDAAPAPLFSECGCVIRDNAGWLTAEIYNSHCHTNRINLSCSIQDLSEFTDFADMIIDGLKNSIESEIPSHLPIWASKPQSIAAETEKDIVDILYKQILPYGRVLIHGIVKDDVTNRYIIHYNVAPDEP
jgi:hypothetical protein